MNVATMGRVGAGTADDAASCDGTDKSTWTDGSPPANPIADADSGPAMTNAAPLGKDAPLDGSRAPTGAGETQQQATLQPLHWRGSWRPLLSHCKAISSHMAGTGTFLVEYERPLHSPQERPAYLQLPAAEQERMLQDTYKAVLAMCDAMVPGNGLVLMDALMETTDVYRKRYGYKKNLFDLDGGRPAGQDQREGQGGAEEVEELVRLTPTLQSLRGSFWLEKDRFFRRRRSCFGQLARSQRARVIKATYELIQAVGEEFSPGTRLDLLDRVFEHHTTLRPVQKQGRREAPEGARPPSQKRVRATEGHTLPPPALGLFASADPLVVAAAHVLAAHWARVMGGSMTQAPMDSSVLPSPPPAALPPTPLQLLQPMMQHRPSGSMLAPHPAPSHPTTATTEAGWTVPLARHASPPQGRQAQGDRHEQSSPSQLVAAVDASHP